MADRTSIPITQATWNPVTGCDRVSPGCKRPHTIYVCSMEDLFHAGVANQALIDIFTVVVGFH